MNAFHSNPFEICSWMANLEQIPIIYTQNHGLQFLSRNNDRQDINEIAQTILTKFRENWELWDLSGQSANLLQLSKLVTTWKKEKDSTNQAKHWKKNPELQGLKQLNHLRKDLLERHPLFTKIINPFIQIPSVHLTPKEFLTNYLTTDTLKSILRKAESDQCHALLKACSYFLTHHIHLMFDKFGHKLMERFQIFKDSHHTYLVMHHSLIRKLKAEGIDLMQDGEEEENGMRLLSPAFFLIGYLNLNLDLPIANYDEDNFFALVQKINDEKDLISVLDNTLVEMYPHWRIEEKLVSQLFEASFRFPLPKLQDYLSKEYIYIINPHGNGSEEYPKKLLCLKETLIQASSYFQVLLEGPFKEGQQKILEFQDERTFQAAAFASNNLVVDIQLNNWEDYIGLADEFQLIKLKERVEDWWLQSIESDQTVETDQAKNFIAFDIAKTHHFLRLEKKTETFIVNLIQSSSPSQIIPLINDLPKTGESFKTIIDQRLNIFYLEHIAQWLKMAVDLKKRDKHGFKVKEAERKKLLIEKNKLSTIIKKEVAPYIRKFNLLKMGIKFNHYCSQFRVTPTFQKKPFQLGLRNEDFENESTVLASLLNLLPELRQANLFAKMGVEVFQTLIKCQHLEIISIDLSNYYLNRSRSKNQFYEQFFTFYLPEICENNPNLKKLIFSEIKAACHLIPYLNNSPHITSLKIKNFDFSLEDSLKLEFIQNIELKYNYFLWGPKIQTFSLSNFPNLVYLKFDFSNQNLFKIIKNGEGRSFTGLQFIFMNKNTEDFKTDNRQTLDLPLLQFPFNVNLREIEIQLPSLEGVEGKNELILILNYLQAAGLSIILPQLGFVKKAPLEEPNIPADEEKGKEKEAYISGETSKSKRRKVFVEE